MRKLTVQHNPTDLDVGCGSNPLGHVNVDLFIGDTEHRANTLIPEEIPNFIQCDACKLPFKDNTFPVVRSKDTLEHVGRKPQRTNPAPYKALKEMIRVSSRKIEVIVPHRFSMANAEKRFWKREHNAFFNLRWFEKVIPRIEKELSIKLSFLVEIKRKPWFWFFLLMPDRIHITFFKREI
jgi:hypothetical protein